MLGTGGVVIGMADDERRRRTTNRDTSIGNAAISDVMQGSRAARQVAAAIGLTNRSEVRVIRRRNDSSESEKLDTAAAAKQCRGNGDAGQRERRRRRFHRRGPPSLRSETQLPAGVTGALCVCLRTISMAISMDCS